MNKLIITALDVEEYKNEQWFIYATQSHPKLRFEVNCVGQYRISSGKDILYFGCDLQEAVFVWNENS